jgi:hypothetical protein
MRPVADAADQAVLDGIDVAILDVAAEILIVANEMFPEAALPDGAFAARDADRAALLGLGNGLGQADLDQAPAQRKIRVTGRQGPNHVDAIGQHYHGIDGKRVARLREPRRLAQRVDMVGQKAAAPV